MCKSLDLNVVNGRKTGDPFGDFTCMKYNGNSVVDYLITSPCIFEKTATFTVGEFIPWLSDHRPVFYTLEIKVHPKSTEPKKTEKNKAPKHYIWTEESKQIFFGHLQTTDFDSRLDRIYGLDQSDPNLLVNQTSEMLISVAERAKIKFAKKDRTNDPPWFDKSCKDMKDSIRNLGKSVRTRPKDESLRNTLFSKKKEFKKLTKTCKIKYKNDLLEKMQQSSKNSKKFWNLLEKMEKRTNDTALKQGISNQRWVSHFKSIFHNSACNTPLPENTAETGILDREISDEEIKLAAYILRNGKSPAFDSISNEMLQCLLQARPDILKTIFNAILRNPRVIDKWSISMINPIHKAGSKMDPDNYRGISLISCFAKFFSAVLNTRLTQYALDKNIFTRSQLGFMAGCRTADALLVLNNLIEFYCKNNNRYIYGCFVDFKKVFDPMFKSSK